MFLFDLTQYLLASRLNSPHSLKTVKYSVCPSPLEKTVVLGVTSRSRDGLKGKAHSCDILARSSRSSIRSRRGWTDLWSPMFDTQTRVQAQPRLHSVCWTRKIWVFRPSSKHVQTLWLSSNWEHALCREREEKHLFNQKRNIASYQTTCSCFQVEVEFREINLKELTFAEQTLWGEILYWLVILVVLKSVLNEVQQCNLLSAKCT